MEKQPGIFISRLVPGGLAESTGLLAVNDEVMEVNGIEVAGKTLDQVCMLPLDGFETIFNKHGRPPFIFFVGSMIGKDFCKTQIKICWALFGKTSFVIFAPSLSNW